MTTEQRLESLERRLFDAEIKIHCQKYSTPFDKMEFDPYLGAYKIDFRKAYEIVKEENDQFKKRNTELARWVEEQKKFAQELKKIMDGFPTIGKIHELIEKYSSPTP